MAWRHQRTSGGSIPKRQQSPELLNLVQISNSLSTGRITNKNDHRAPNYKDSALQNVTRHLVETDGETSTSTAEAPGQNTVYIPSGDHRREIYRLATFEKFPKYTPVNTSDLACAGFYYVGFGDRVKCYWCGIVVENWVQGDNGSDARWHKSDCAIADGRAYDNIRSHHSATKDLFKKFLSTTPRNSTNASPRMPCSLEHHSFHLKANSVQSVQVSDDLADGASKRNNVPSITRWQPPRLGDIHSQEHRDLISSLDMRKESDRRTTFSKWPSYPAPALAAKLAQEGFFYLGNLDRTQCFSCCGVLRNWGKNDTPRTEHGRHFPHCSIIQGTERQNIPMGSVTRQRLDFQEQQRNAVLRSVSPREPEDPLLEEKERLAVQYPCRNPVNPQMESEGARLNTFIPSWPENRLKCTPREIAKAGFFFLGQGDKTKCYYCNGGLQNWEENDEPWTEHAKWFPGCEFILRRKGADFVRALVRENPNLNRPAIRNPVSYLQNPSQPSRPLQAASPQTQTFTGPPMVAVAAHARNTGLAGEPSQNRQGSLCRACHSAVPEILCRPCCHVSLCTSCASGAQQCPFCKSRIDSTIKIRR